VLRLGCYVRYCDDFVVLANDKRALWDVRADVAAWLASLRLKLHPAKCRVYQVGEGVDFLGYRVWPDHRRLRRASVARFRRRRLALRASWHEGRTDLSHIRASLASWNGHAKHADAWRLRACLAAFDWLAA